MDSLIAQASKHLSQVLTFSIKHTPKHKALVIYDREAPLAGILTDAYMVALPEGEFLDFADTSAEDILNRINALAPEDLVILVQSSNFRLNEFRIRIELFQRKLKTIEHMHLKLISEDQFSTYIEALAYNKEYFQQHGLTLKPIIDNAQRVVVKGEGTELVYEGGMEPAKLNIGDYTGMENVGGTFPIGEVFSEPKDLKQINGEAMLAGFAGMDHTLKQPTPFKVTVKQGILTAGDDAPAEFHEILDLIRADEEVTVREFGLGFNPAMDEQRIVNDITAYERRIGLHISLGAKHGVYKKPGFNNKKTRYHIDVFVDAKEIVADGRVIFKDGAYILE